MLRVERGAVAHARGYEARHVKRYVPRHGNCNAAKMQDEIFDNSSIANCQLIGMAKATTGVGLVFQAKPHTATPWEFRNG